MTKTLDLVDGPANDDGGWALTRNPALSSPRAVQVHAALHEAILDHRLRPGRALPEDEIGAIYGVSRTIVRYALQALAHERLVVIEPNRGAQVAEPSAEEAREVFEARSVIEPRVAAIAATRARPDDVALLRRHIAEESAALARGETERAIAMSAAFHLSIARIAGQSILEQFVSELLSRSSLIVALYWRRHDAMCESHAHGALVDALARGDGEAAADLMLSHIVDLLSGLDLRPKPTEPQKLSDVLMRGPAGR